jgi:hypothetical protein
MAILTRHRGERNYRIKNVLKEELRLVEFWRDDGTLGRTGHRLARSTGEGMNLLRNCA